MLKTIRSIQVVNVRWFNASAWYGLFISKLLKENGHETLVLGLPDTKCFKVAQDWGLEPIGLELNKSSPISIVSNYRKLHKIIKDFKPNVVNCHRGEAFFLLGLLKKKLRSFALVRTRGDQRLPNLGWFNKKLYCSTADALIATNSILTDFFISKMGADLSSVHTILGGVDEKTFYPSIEEGNEVRKALGYAEDDFVVGILGRLDPVKGHAVLIDALSIIKEVDRLKRPIKLLCIGDESSLKFSDINAMLEAKGLKDDAVITGRVDNVRAYINAMDLGVLASIGSEAIARAALEIMACGIPLESSRVGVMPDILPRSTLFPIGDAPSLAKSIEIAASSQDRYNALKSISKKAIKPFASDIFLEKTLDAYRLAAIHSGDRIW